MHTIFWDRFYQIIFWRQRSRFIFYMLQIMHIELKVEMQKDRKKYSEYIYSCIICLQICAW